MSTATNKEVLDKFAQLYREVFSHDGHGHICVEMKILRRGQKEVIIDCGKQYRFVVDFANKVPAVQNAAKTTGIKQVKQACESGFDA